jgi:hypothetical protein
MRKALHFPGQEDCVTPRRFAQLLFLSYTYTTRHIRTNSRIELDITNVQVKFGAKIWCFLYDLLYFILFWINYDLLYDFTTYFVPRHFLLYDMLAFLVYVQDREAACDIQ